MAGGGMFLGDIFSVAPGGQRAFERITNTFLPKNNYPDISVMAQLVLMRYVSEKDYYALADAQGYSKSMALLFLRASDRRLEPLDYITYWRRGYMSSEMLDKKLAELKIPSYEITALKNISSYFPSPADLVRFAVREVYTPDVANKYGLFKELPDKFITESAKAGLPKEQAGNYWASHWELPSISMGFEMFHRQTSNPEPGQSDDITTPSGGVTNNIIGKDTLSQLLKALDVMPYWRDKLIELSYNPLTRVDVRRMYGLGVLTVDQVFENYLNSGYSPKNAELMTEFTVKYESNEFDGITRATLVSGYMDGIITIEELREYLTGIGYTEKTIDFWISQAEFDKVMADIKIKSDDMVELYQMGAIDLQEVQSGLLAMDVPAQYITAVIEKVIKVKAKRTKVPSLDDLKQWLKEQLIDEEYFTGRMRLLGYKDTDIQLYLTEISKNLDTTKIDFLPITTYIRWLTNGIMSSDDFINTLFRMGLSEDDITRLLNETWKK